MLAARLRFGAELRRKVGQAEIAGLLGMEQATLSRWENGTIPDAAEIERAAHTLGLRPAWLLLGEGEMFPPNGATYPAALARPAVVPPTDRAMPHPDTVRKRKGKSA